MQVSVVVLAVLAALVVLSGSPAHERSGALVVLASTFCVALVWGDGLARWSSMRELRVGLDELTYVALGRARSFGVADITDLDLSRELVITMRDGSEARISLDAVDPALRAACDERVWSARAAAKRLSGVGRQQGERLRRAGRSVAEWRKALAGLVVDGGGYRDAAGFGRRDALGLLADPGAEPELRVAAALAIAEGGAAEDRRRIALAARCTASTALRAALEETLRDVPDETLVLAAIDDPWPATESAPPPADA